MMGFFLILLTEQVAKTFQARSKPKEVRVKEFSESSSGEGEHVEFAVSTSVAGEISDGNISDSETSDLDMADKQTLLINGMKKKRYRHHQPAGHMPSHNHSHHGHGHSHSEAFKSFAEGEVNVRCIMMILALAIHAVFEGLAVGLQDNVSKLISLYVPVLIHECLVSFAMGVSLAKQSFSTIAIVKISLIFCAMLPVGMISGLLIGEIKNFMGNLVSAVIQGIAAGTFIYVIFLEILPEDINTTEDRLWKFLFLFIGYVVIAILPFLEL